MNDNFLNKVGLKYFYDRIKLLFASQSDFDTLEDKVDEIIAEGGEPNVIETVKVNGTALTPVNKAVDVIVPTKTSDLTNDSNFATTSDIPTAVSDLTNDGDGTSPFATESYVSQNGGKIQKIKVNGVEQTIDTGDKSVDITVPTKVSDLTNDSGFITNTVNNLTNYYTKSETYTKAEVDSAISAITSLDIQVVQTLPTQDISTTTIYLVPKSTAKTNNAYDEYIYVNNSWELIGDTQLDLSNYWNSTNLVAITTSEIDTIISGS